MVSQMYLTLKGGLRADIKGEKCGWLEGKKFGDDVEERETISVLLLLPFPTIADKKGSFGVESG